MRAMFGILALVITLAVIFFLYTKSLDTAVQSSVGTSTIKQQTDVLQKQIGAENKRTEDALREGL